MGISDKSWENYKKLAYDKSFFEKLNSIDESVNPKILKDLAVYIEKPEFQVQNIKNVSLCMALLADFVINRYHYLIILKEVIQYFK